MQHTHTTKKIIQYYKRNSPFILQKPKHERIRMRTPLTPIHDKQFRQRKLQPSRQLINLLLQRPLGQFLVLVKHWHNHHRNQRHHDHRKDKGKCPHIEIERLSPHLNNFEQQCHERPAKRTRESQSLDLVRHEQSRSHFIKSVLLLDTKCGIQFKGKSGDRSNDHGNGHEN